MLYAVIARLSVLMLHASKEQIVLVLGAFHQPKMLRNKCQMTAAILATDSVRCLSRAKAL